MVNFSTWYSWNLKRLILSNVTLLHFLKILLLKCYFLVINWNVYFGRLGNFHMLLFFLQIRVCYICAYEEVVIIKLLKCRDKTGQYMYKLLSVIDNYHPCPFYTCFKIWLAFKLYSLTFTLWQASVSRWSLQSEFLHQSEFSIKKYSILYGVKVSICLCWGFTAQSTQWGHVERGQFT